MSRACVKTIGRKIRIKWARFYADPDRLRAEFAVAVRSDWKGRGVGYLLMKRLIAVAQEWGLGELFGEVLRENRPMLALLRSLGFEEPEPARDGIARLELALG